MNGMDWAAWTVAIGTLGLLWFTVRYRGQDAGAAKMNERLAPIEAALTRHDAHHDRHFSAAQMNASAIASLNQQIADHEKHDEERFGRIEQMHKEIRDDIKELMQR